MVLYGELDRQVAVFSAASGLHCPQGCGDCCRSEKVEATVLEMLPLAFHLFRTSQAELLVKRLEKDPEVKQCLLYRADFCLQGMWGCSQYLHRGLVCRLFGFAGNRDRTGKPQLARCRVMKSVEGPVVEEHLPVGMMPLFSEAGMRITTLNPTLGTDRLPINRAILYSLYKVGIYLDMKHMKYAEHPDGSTDKPTSPPSKPFFPSSAAPRRAA
ncbi:conserved hypothetical protein [delta proteobacterium NaphS2]|nr:conserved hypothetical protein [delta proteobacterium NaphS2]